MKKPSFFSKLSGNDADEFDYYENPEPNYTPEREEPRRTISVTHKMPTRAAAPAPAEESSSELALDIYQTPDAIVVKALVAGVQPATIDIALTREMLTISGVREDEREVSDENYFQRELYWGSFSRTILLPEEVDVDMAEASEKHGILMIRLPKINKKRETKLKVRSR